ncbi:hypothetical protein ACHAWF_019033 [Thalassiosira exigua]
MSFRWIQSILRLMFAILHYEKYVWSTASCGKFTAPLLQTLSPRFSDSMVGMTFALQYAIVASMAGWAGFAADAQEKKYSSWGCGRLIVLTFGIFIGTLAFLGHGVPEHFSNIFPSGSTVILVWQIAMRCFYAVAFGLAAPCLDGLALAHLECAEGTSTIDFGKERMYGAIWWGLGSLAAGVGSDYFGFDFLYAIIVVSAVATYISMGVYLWGVNNDSTGSFKSHAVTDTNGAMSRPEYQHQEATSTGESNASLSNGELLCMVCKTGYGQALLFFTFTLSMGISVVDNLAFIFFDSLGSSYTMDGLTVVFTVLFEIPVFYVAPKLLEWYGPGKLLLAAGIAYIIRVIGYTLVPEGKMYLILMLEMLHGVTYAGSKAGSVEFIAQIIPEGYEASGQGILIFVTYSGVVGGLVIAGWIQELFGARVMFRLMAAIVSFGVVVLLLAEILHDRRREKKESVSQESNRRRGTKEPVSQNSNDEEHCHLTSSDSYFADESTERYMTKLKYDSLGKYVKDW